jgi:CrcB protein
MKWLLVFVGGGIGAMLRVAAALWVDQRLGPPFPWGTLAVNVTGCFAVGLVATLADERALLSPPARLFLLAGVLGGYTTFSTFGLETWRLLAEGEALAAVGNAAASLAGGLVAVVAGVLAGRALA